MSPSVNPDAEREMDKSNLRSIHIISLIGLIFEVVAAIAFMVSIRGKIDNDALVSVISISFSI